MKILILTPNLHCGGAEKVLSLLSKQWKTKKTVIFCLFDISNQFFIVDTKIYNLNAAAKNNIFFKFYNYFIRVFNFQKILKKENPDLVISFTESANFVSILGCIFAKKRKNLIISVRTNLDHYSIIIRLMARLLYNLSYQVVVPSSGLEKLLLNNGIKREKLKVINNPVEFRFNQNDLKNEINIQKPYILAVGRLSKEKGFERLIESFSKLNNDVELVFIGEGPEQENLERQCQLLNIENRVKFLGFLKDLQNYYKGARFLALTSYYEGWPNVILEAMSFKCPVIAFDCDFGPREIMQNYINGILVEKGNIKLFTKEMEKLLSDNNLHSKLSKNAFKRAKDFNLDTISKQWLQLLRN
ncbi:MAG: hypothetical protein CMP38_01165 [Rickettsiales bacterium]|nr:hypothetical protein [Rickettsiales bacterium]